MPPEQTTGGARLDAAEADFPALKMACGLSIAHVVAFFPQEQNIAYLQQLIAESKAPVKHRKTSHSE